MLRREQRMTESEDAYVLDAKLPDPARCTKCKATYLKGRWTWRAAPEGAAAYTCPACRRIADDLPAGYVKLRGGFLPQHRDEVLNVVTNRAARAEKDHPLQRIMAVKTTGDGTLVTTTHTHLARDIAQALHEAFKGELEMTYSKDEHLLRATWTR